MRIFLYLSLIFLSKLIASESNYDIKLFGTIGGVYNTNSDYIFRKDAKQANGSSNDFYYYTDTLVGIQPTLILNDSFSLISQAIIQKDEYDELKTKIDSGYLKYDSGNNYSIKAGRIRIPYYKNSDNNNIGYSKLTIREPIEVYGQVPFSAYDGIELTYSNIIDKYFYTIQANYGKESFSTPMHSLNQKTNTVINDISAINFSFGTDEIESRLTYMRGVSTTTSPYLDNVFKYVRVVDSNELADEYEFKNKRSEYLSLGFFVDKDNFILSSEYGQRRAKSFYADASGYYMTLGYRFDNITPYISYAKIKMDQKTSNTGSLTLDKLMKVQNIAQSSNTVGFKYYINKNLDFKLEYQRIKPKGIYGGFYLDPTNEYPNSTLNVFSFAINFVF